MGSVALQLNVAHDVDAGEPEEEHLSKRGEFRFEQQIPQVTFPISVTPNGQFSTFRQPIPQQENGSGGFVCGDCGRTYKLKSSLRNHQKWECGKEPQFQCPYCIYKAKQKMHMARHMERMHRDVDYSSLIKGEVKTPPLEGTKDYSTLKENTAELKADEESSS